MAKRIPCIGRNSDGQPCKNYALHGSFYCFAHQSQITDEDKKSMENGKEIAMVIMVVLAVVAILIAVLSGSEGAMKWLTK